MAESGLQFLSAGSVESLYVGSTYELKLGSVNEIMVGTEAKINAAVSNSVSFEAEMAYKAGCGVEWSNVGGYKIEQGEVFELKEESSQFATTELKFQAARTLPAVGAGVPLDAIKSTIKKMLLSLAAVNLAIGVAEGAALGTNSLGETENRPNEEGVEQDGWKAGSVGLASSALSATASIVAYAVLKKSIEALMTAYKALPAVSTVTLSETGIKQQANFTATGSLLNMSATGVAIKSGAGAVAIAGTGDLSSLSLGADGNAVLNGALSTTVKSPVVVKVGQLIGEDLSTGLSAEVAAVSLKNTNASQVRLLPEAAEMRALEVNVHSGVNGFSVNAEEAKMTCGPTAVTASNISLALSVDEGSSGMRVYPSFVVVDAPLIQLG
jgi:hypothetical protein